MQACVKSTFSAWSWLNPFFDIGDEYAYPIYMRFFRNLYISTLIIVGMELETESYNIENCYMCRLYAQHLDRDTTDKERCGRCGEKFYWLK